MKHIIKAAMIASVLAAGAASAQTPNTASPASPTARPVPGSPTLTSPTAGMGLSETGTTTPALGATSQANPPRSTSSAPAAVSTSTAPSRTTEAPVDGANSFTESQARSRIEDRGFGNVTGLKKDPQGVWRGTAMKDGKSIAVALDYQGNIVSR